MSRAHSAGSTAPRLNAWRAILFLILVITASRAYAEEITVNVDGVNVAFEPTTGWCMFAPVERRQIVENLNKLSGDVIVLTVFANCDHVNPKNRPRVFEMGYLSINKQEMGQDMDMDRADFLAQQEAGLKQLVSPREMTEFEDNVNDSDLGVEMDRGEFLGVVGRDKLAVYYAIKRSSTVDSTTYREVSVTGVTLIKRRILSCTVSTEFKGVVSINDMLEQAKREISHLFEVNQ